MNGQGSKRDPTGGWRDQGEALPAKAIDADVSSDTDPEIVEIRFTVEPGCHDWRLDRYLQHKIRRLSRSKIALIIRDTLSLNGAPVRKSGVKVRRGDAVLIRRPLPEEPPVPKNIAVVGEGPGWLALDKPAGLPVHPTARYLHNTLTGVVKERFGPGSGLNMAHRLDRETSGVVLFGTSPEATRALKASFRQGAVTKRYLAIVEGDLAETRTVDAPIGPALGSVIRIRMGVRPDGQPARTRFEPLQRFGSHTLVTALPETGRQHQIRVHLESLGLRLLGDKLYGRPDDFFLTLVEEGLSPAMQKELGLPRHALHAAYLRFPRPDGQGEKDCAQAPLAPDLIEFLQGLGAPRGDPGRNAGECEWHRGDGGLGPRSSGDLGPHRGGQAPP